MHVGICAKERKFGSKKEKELLMQASEVFLFLLQFLEKFIMWDEM